MATESSESQILQNRRTENRAVFGGALRFAISFASLIALALLLIGVFTTGVAAVWSASGSVSSPSPRR
ncbi:MAG: hypothetical protein U0136_02140 [Bdellovibrionota bacterium]